MEGAFHCILHTLYCMLYTLYLDGGEHGRVVRNYVIFYTLTAYPLALMAASIVERCATMLDT